jgi:hypothetical protein
MIKGAQQAIEYGSAAARLYYAAADDQGRKQWPDSYPTAAVYGLSGGLLDAATVAAELDLAAAGCANLDTVIEASSPGTWGSGWTLQVAAAAAAAVTVDRDARTILIEYEDAVTTVADVEALIAALERDHDVIAIKTTGTGAAVLGTPGDDLAATALAGGVGAALVPQMARYEGLLDYDAQTAEFEVGEKVTGGTSGATGIIRGQERRGTAGTLHLGDVDGTFRDNEALTDSGSGAATCKGWLYTCDHVLEIDASATTTWEMGQNYRAEISYQIGGRTYTRQELFDVAWAPMCYPIVTSHDIEEIHPTWAKVRPESWRDWGPAVRGGHADLVRRIHSMGEQAAEYIKRTSEFWKVELAFVERWIAINCGFPPEETKRWEERAESAWGERGLLTTMADEEDTAAQQTIQARLVR